MGAVPEMAEMVAADKSAGVATVSVINVIVGIIPKSVVTPFYAGNLLQVLFLSCFFGFFLVKSGERAATVKGGIEFFNRFFGSCSFFFFRNFGYLRKQCFLISPI